MRAAPTSARPMLLGVGILCVAACTLAVARTEQEAVTPAFCPVSEITSCKSDRVEKCTPKLWHGIDSLEMYELLPINSTAVSIRSLNNPPSFEDTIGVVSIRSKGSGLPVSAYNINLLHCFLGGQHAHCYVSALKVLTMEHRALGAGLHADTCNVLMTSSL